MSVLSTICPSAPKYDTSSGVYVSLGSNQSYRGLSSSALLLGAMKRMETGGEIILATSSFWKSDAWPAKAGAPDFINAVCQIRPYDNEPALLLKRLHQIEAEFGRVRDPLNRWSARSLDLDLLDYNGCIMENNSFLTLPHPRITVRDFVLKPLLEVSPNWVHPITQESGQILLDGLVAKQLTNNCIQLS